MPAVILNHMFPDGTIVMVSRLEFRCRCSGTSFPVRVRLEAEAFGSGGRNTRIQSIPRLATSSN